MCVKNLTSDLALFANNFHTLFLENHTAPMTLKNIFLYGKYRDVMAVLLPFFKWCISRGTAPDMSLNANRLQDTPRPVITKHDTERLSLSRSGT